MVLTYNYEDLQNIKEKLQREHVKNGKKIYHYIEMYKETLNFMYDNNLAPNKSKEYLEKELHNFATKLLSNTDKTYKQLEQQYKSEIITTYNIKPNGITLKL